MPTYVCVDGPLSGQLFDWREGAREGEVLTIGLVDVGQHDVPPEAETEADYVVEHGDDAVTGRLRFVAGRGAWRGEPLVAEPVPA